MLVLPYTEATSKIQDGDLLFMRSRSRVSKIIQFFTRSQYSHVGIAFWARIGEKPRLMIIEAQRGSKRRVQNLNVYAHDDIDVMPSPYNWLLYEEEAFKELGIRDYNLYEACYVGLREYLLKRWNIHLPLAKFKGEICSEFIARLLHLEHVEVSPQGLFEQLNTKGHSISMEIRTLKEKA